jgi:hypothetical protein
LLKFPGNREKREAASGREGARQNGRTDATLHAW